MSVKIEALKRYPIKGLSGEDLASVNLEQGKGFPGDRKYGFARPDSGFNPSDPKPLPKSKFYMLARDASLALLNTNFDEHSCTLTMTTPWASEQFDISSGQGKTAASEFLKSYLQLPDRETPVLFEASPHRFTDVSVESAAMMNAVSIINLDSVREFALAVDQDVDPNRFRGNIQLAGLGAFTELELVGRELAIGNARFRVVKRTKRCPATEVNLNNGERDLKTPKLLLAQYGHMDMGVYAEVITGGTISCGDPVSIN